MPTVCVGDGHVAKPRTEVQYAENIQLCRGTCPVTSSSYIVHPSKFRMNLFYWSRALNLEPSGASLDRTRARMQIAFYAPLKRLDHPHPSGDLAIGTGLYRFLQGRGHALRTVSKFPSRWIYWKPWLWPRLVRARNRSLESCHTVSADIWMTYHSYYKAPDVLGPVCCSRLALPYVIFQGIYSTKRRKHWRTRVGFVLNRRALAAADHIFTNRKEDLANLARIVPERKLTYVVPGILPEHFGFDVRVRKEMQQKLDIADGVVVLSAAMFRPGVKSEGLATVIRSCSEIFRRDLPLYLLIAGDGKERNRLRRLADRCLPGRVRFLGPLAREEMYRFYSAGDVFVFPGIRESLGMVYLEAQSCGLPVVAFADGGVPEVVSEGVSGYLVRPYDGREFNRALDTLVADSVLRRKMGEAARSYVRKHHDLHGNYRIVEDVLFSLVEERRSLGNRVIGSLGFSRGQRSEVGSQTSELRISDFGFGISKC